MALVLTVDDEPDVTAMIALTLRLRNYEVLQAHDGREALHLARERCPDLILLDFMMPELTGYDVALKLKEDRSTADIPIIFITAKSRAEDWALGLGIAVDYICKPFTSSDLLSRVKEAIGTHQLERQLEQLEREGHLYAHSDEQDNTPAGGQGTLLVPLPPEARKQLEAMAARQGLIVEHMASLALLFALEVLEDMETRFPDIDAEMHGEKDSEPELHL